MGEKRGGDRCSGGWFGLEGRARGSREKGGDWVLDMDQCFVSCSGRALRLGKEGWRCDFVVEEVNLEKRFDVKFVRGIYLTHLCTY